MSRRAGTALRAAPHEICGSAHWSANDGVGRRGLDRTGAVEVHGVDTGSAAERVGNGRRGLGGDGDGVHVQRRDGVDRGRAGRLEDRRLVGRRDRAGEGDEVRLGRAARCRRLLGEGREHRQRQPGDQHRGNGDHRSGLRPAQEPLAEHQLPSVPTPRRPGGSCALVVDHVVPRPLCIPLHTAPGQGRRHGWSSQHLRNLGMSGLPHMTETGGLCVQIGERPCMVNDLILSADPQPLSRPDKPGPRRPSLAAEHPDGGRPIGHPQLLEHRGHVHAHRARGR